MIETVAGTVFLIVVGVAVIRFRRPLTTLVRGTRGLTTPGPGDRFTLALTVIVGMVWIGAGIMVATHA